MNPATLHICRCGHDRDDHQSRTEQEDGQKVQVEKCEHCPCRAYVRRLGPLDTLVETYRAAALPASQGTAEPSEAYDDPVYKSYAKRPASQGTVPPQNESAGEVDRRPIRAHQASDSTMSPSASRSVATAAPADPALVTLATELATVERFINEYRTHTGETHQQDALEAVKRCQKAIAALSRPSPPKEQ
jgi:hypothetical protein